MRRLLALALAFTLAIVALPAIAGSYLDRAAVLLGETRRADEFMLTHFTDRELAMVTHELAEARVKVARKMLVPKEVGNIHPHLLLTLENAERATAAAEEGSLDTFMHHLRIARDEDASFRALLAQQKLDLPAIAK